MRSTHIFQKFWQQLSSAAKWTAFVRAVTFSLMFSRPEIFWGRVTRESPANVGCFYVRWVERVACLHGAAISQEALHCCSRTSSFISYQTYRSTNSPHLHFHIDDLPVTRTTDSANVKATQLVQLVSSTSFSHSQQHIFHFSITVSICLSGRCFLEEFPLSKFCIYSLSAHHNLLCFIN
jgi:hypothetical protein